VSPDDVRRRLRRRADELGLDFQQAIQYYAIERFLFRLSKSEFASKLVVKGATKDYRDCTKASRHSTTRYSVGCGQHSA
jgi:hypothetical protein